MNVSDIVSTLEACSHVFTQQPSAQAFARVRRASPIGNKNHCFLSSKDLSAATIADDNQKSHFGCATIVVYHRLLFSTLLHFRSFFTHTMIRPRMTRLTSSSSSSSSSSSMADGRPLHRRTMGQNQVILRHQKFTFPRARE